jgi:hypothetical protein
VLTEAGVKQTEAAARQTVHNSSSSGWPEQETAPERESGKRRRKTHGAWRQVVLCRAQWLRHEVLSRASGDGPTATEQHILQLVATAEKAAGERGGLMSWFEGCQQERTWLSLHEAEAELIELLRGEDLNAHAEDILRKARRVLGADDPRVRWVESRLAEHDCTSSPPARSFAPRVARLARATFDVLDDQYAQSRGFRNRLIRISGIAFVGVVGLFVATAFGQLDLNTPGSDVIPRGWQPSLWIVLFGVVGAIVSAVPPLARAQGARNPFSLPVFQLVLKLVMGPLFAFVGVLMIQGNVIAEIEQVDSVMSLVVWATLFGAGQQSVTRLIDRRAKGIVSSGAGSESASGSAQTPTHNPRPHRIPTLSSGTNWAASSDGHRVVEPPGTESP